MSTVDKKFAERIITNNGYYSATDADEPEAPDNPRCVKLVEYTNAWNRKAYGATFANETPERQDRYLEESEYIRDPKVIWTYTPPESAKDLHSTSGTNTGRMYHKIDPNPQPLSPGQKEIADSIPMRVPSPGEIFAMPYSGPYCKGKNCSMPVAADHSPECIAEHEAAYSSGGAPSGKVMNVFDGNFPSVGMDTAEARDEGAKLDVNAHVGLNIQVRQDGVWIDFQGPDGKSALIHSDTIGPPTGIIRDAIDSWANQQLNTIGYCHQRHVK